MIEELVEQDFLARGFFSSRINPSLSRGFQNWAGKLEERIKEVEEENETGHASREFKGDEDPF